MGTRVAPRWRGRARARGELGLRGGLAMQRKWWKNSGKARGTLGSEGRGDLRGGGSRTAGTEDVRKAGDACERRLSQATGPDLAGGAGVRRGGRWRNVSALCRDNVRRGLAPSIGLADDDRRSPSLSAPRSFSGANFRQQEGQVRSRCPFRDLPSVSPRLAPRRPTRSPAIL